MDLFAVQSDGNKILDQQKQRSMCSRLRMELLRPLRVALVNRGPDSELLVANPVEVSGKGRPLVLYDITLALKNLHRRVFLVMKSCSFLSDKHTPRSDRLFILGL